MMALAVAAFGLLAVYLVSLGKTPEAPPRPGALETAHTAAQFLATGFGPFAAVLWPLFGVIVAVVAPWTPLRRARAGRRMRAGGLRVLGLLCFGGAMLCLAVGIGLGRGGGITPRYATMAAPVLCLAYFVGRDGRRPVVAWGLAALMAAFFVANTVIGIQ